MNIKRMFDACYQAKRTREMLPPLPEGVRSSFIQYLDTIQSLEGQGVQVKVSDISDAMELPRPGVTRTVKEMEEKGYLKKMASEADGRVTYIAVTRKGTNLSQKYDEQYFKSLLPYMEEISDEDAECMIRTIEKFYQIMCERRNITMNDKADFTQGSILKKLIAFMIPVLGSLILQAAYGAVDLLVVGRFGSTSGLSAVSTGSQVLNLVTFVVTQFAMGITVLIARYLGEKRPEQIGSVIGGSAVVFTMIAVGLFIVMVGFAHPISVLMQAPKEAVELTSVYVRICGGGIFFIVAYNLLSAIFRGLGDSKSPLLFVFVACIVNVIGDIVLVAGFHMDAAGAAIATVTAQALSVVFAIVILIKKELPFKITRKDFGLNSQCKKFLKIGLPLALQEFLTQMSFLALCAFVNRLGLEASSGYGVACKIVNFAMLVPSALMQSMASFVSQNIGAGKAKRAKKSMFTGIGVGLVVGCIVFLLVMFGGDILAGFFTTDVAVIQKGYAYLKGFALETIVTAILFSMVGYFNGNNKTVWVMTQGLIQTLLVRLPFAYVMSIQPNASLTKIGLAAPVSTMVGIVLNVGFYIYLDRAEKKVTLYKSLYV